MPKLPTTFIPPTSKNKDAMRDIPPHGIERLAGFYAVAATTFLMASRNAETGWAPKIRWAP